MSEPTLHPARDNSLESSLHLCYLTPETNDPGRFVYIVPADTMPKVEVVAMAPATGVELKIYGRAGRTHIVECSPDTVEWTAISTNVMPATVCITCPFIAVTDATDTTIGNRFYRVVEVP